MKEMIEAFRKFIGQNAMMAYLVMMTPAWWNFAAS